MLVNWFIVLTPNASTMKTFYTLSVILLLPLLMRAQAPALTLTAEEVVIAENALSAIQSTTGGAPYCIRLYASFPDNFELQVVYGNTFNPLSLQAGGIFYQHPEGGPTTKDINPGLIPLLPALGYDSWLTIGYTNQADNQLTVLPLDLSVFSAWEAGANLLVNDLVGGAVSMGALPTAFPPNTPGASGQVLIAQLTGTGDFSGCLNLQLRRLNPNGTVFDPPGSATSETYAYNNICFNYAFGPEEPCAGDFDQNGLVATSDVLLFMSDFGCASACAKDLTGDGGVFTSDLLILLGVFGTACPD
jgi:hypothetical protein